MQKYVGLTALEAIEAVVKHMLRMEPKDKITISPYPPDADITDEWMVSISKTEEPTDFTKEMIG